MGVIDTNFVVPDFDEGVYRLQCDKAIYKSNKSGDGKIINMQMSIVDSPDEEWENEKIFDNPSFKTTARWKMNEVLRAFLQLSVDDMEDFKLEYDDDSNEVEQLQGQTALAILYMDTYNGNPQVRVKTYLPDDGTVNLGPVTDASGS